MDMAAEPSPLAHVAASGIRRALVTGGLGFIGQHLSRLLVTLGVEVTVWDVDMSRRPLVPQAVRVEEVDLRRAIPPGGLDRFDHVFHLAGNPSTRRSLEDPRFDFDANITSTFNVAEAALRCRLQRMVFLSSALVYGQPRTTPIDEEHPTNPLVPYAGSKLACEVYLNAMSHALGLPVVIGRCFAVYGPGENPETAEAEVGVYVRSWGRGEPITVLGDLDKKTRDFIHVTDVARALVFLAGADVGEVVNIGSGEEISIRNMIDIIGDIAGRAPDVSHADAYWNDSFRHVADISKLKSFGFLPTVSLRDGIQRLLVESST